jgi:phosphoribosylformylglycinamidine cyclo-ligase
MEEEMTYSRSGVETDREDAMMKGLLQRVSKTFSFREGLLGKPVLALGHFANVLDLGQGKGLAISADGVGTKMLVAEMVGKYDTVGIDCVAMNVNDLLCVGAEPFAMVNYIAAETLNADILEQIGKGLAEGARQARISICGGETAQLREMIRGKQAGKGLDLAGAAVGIVDLERIISGRDVLEGDVVVGLPSSGIHSNGFTLARKVFFEKLGLSPDKHLPELGRTIGEELLEPTRIYVPQVVEMLQQGVRIKAASHITGGGLLNLTRIEARAGFILGSLPEPQPVFHLIQKHGNVAVEEMYRVFNMGVGFCFVCPEADVDKAGEIAKRHGTLARCLGYAVHDPDRKIVLPEMRLLSRGKAFVKS